MKIICNVRASEFVTRTYTINVGTGNQFVSWLASTACLQFGQEHYPNGIYIPSLLKKENDEIPHPRNRIKDTDLKDGDVVYITLKDKTKEPDEDEKIWYRQAFGNKRNIMKVEIHYQPESSTIKQTEYRLVAKCKYEMYKEMVPEFKVEDYKTDWQQDMICEDVGTSAQSSYEYYLSFELPFGDFSAEALQCEYGLADTELNPLIESERPAFKVILEPRPISLEKQKEADQKEEEDNKAREQEASAAQKRLEEEKAKLRFEQQNQIMKQEQNSAKLKVYFRAMNLSFHKQEEDFNASMSFLSIYHGDLAENFQYYASVFEPYYLNRKENELIPLQGFFHFMKLMKLASSIKQVVEIFNTLSEIEGIQIPIEDTLNVKNGMNYAQFLEAILRIGYLRTSEGPEGSFKNTLEKMFQQASIDINKRMEQEQALSYVYNQETVNVFLNNEVLLCAIFLQKAQNRYAAYHELSKGDFCEMLGEAKILIEPKPKKEGEEQKTEEKEKAPQIIFDAAKAYDAIKEVGSFDPEQLDYFNFLEALVRIALQYPYNEEQKATMTSFTMKLEFFIEKLNAKYSDHLEQFKMQRDEYEKAKNYQPKMVVDDEEEDEDSDEDM